MATGADYFDQIIGQGLLIVDQIPGDRRTAALLQYVTGAVIGEAAELFRQHAYEVGQDLITLCEQMNKAAYEQQLADDPECREFTARAVARLAGIPIPEPKIPQDQLDDREACKGWAREILSLAGPAPEKSIWLHVDDRCCFGGSVEACGKPIDGVQIVAASNELAAVCYCEYHGKIMAEVIAERRSTSGSMTADEIERMSEGD